MDGTSQGRNTCVVAFDLTTSIVIFTLGKGKAWCALEIMSLTEIQRFLQNQLLGRLAMATPDGVPYVIPMPFCYLNDCIYLRLPITGRKGSIITANNRVCFEVDTCSPRMDYYASVIVDGVIAPVTSVVEKATAREATTDKYRRLRDQYRPGHGRQTSLEDLPTMRIAISCLSGRKIGEQSERNVSCSQTPSTEAKQSSV